MKMELRVQDSKMELNSDGTLTVSGYVNKTNEPSNVLGSEKRFVERISKGVFTRAIENSKRDIDFLAEHDSSKILASTRNDSLTLHEDESGLYMEATIAPTSWGRDAYTLIESGIYRNMSFGFKVVKDKWKSIENGLYERTIEDLELFEVSVVKNPAYSQSTIAARGIDVVEDVEPPSELQEEEIDLDELKELMISINERLASVLDELSDLKEKDDDKEKEDEQSSKDKDEKDESDEKDVPKETDESDKKESIKEEEEVVKEAPVKEEVVKEEVVKEKVTNEVIEDEEEDDEEDDEDKKKEQKRSYSVDLSDFKNRLKALK